MSRFVSNTLNEGIGQKHRKQETNGLDRHAGQRPQQHRDGAPRDMQRTEQSPSVIKRQRQQGAGDVTLSQQRSARRQTTRRRICPCPWRVARSLFPHDGASVTLTGIALGRLQSMRRVPLLLILAATLSRSVPTLGADPQPYSVTLKPTGNKTLDSALHDSSSLISLQEKAPVGGFALVERARQDADGSRQCCEAMGHYAARPI